MNFNETSGKNVTSDDIESDKKQSSSLSLNSIFFFKHIFTVTVTIFSEWNLAIELAIFNLI